MEVEQRTKRRQRGITLLELLTTVAVIGVSLAVLVPNLAGIADRSRITTTANHLLADLRYARNTAVTRRAMVSLCPSDDADTCSGDPRGWQRGYLIFVDTDGDRRRSAGEALLRVGVAQPNGLRLHSTAGRPAIRFRADGAAWSTNTTFSVCLGPQASHYRAVVLYGSGRARVDRRAPGDRPVTCR